VFIVLIVSRKGAKERKDAINFAPFVIDLSVLAWNKSWATMRMHKRATQRKS